MSLPLSGLTVVALEQAVAAPFATRQLADLGARVIKVERPGTGDFARGYDRTVRGQSSYFVWLNRSKESLTLDLKRPEARAALERLLDRADVVVQNLAPGAAARLGLAPDDLHARHPRAVICEISGYGEPGPYAGKKAYDLLVQAEAGVLAVTGTPEAPSKVGISIADIAAGMYAFSGVLAALLARATSGHGAIVRVSMLDALAEWMSAPAYYTGYGGVAPARTGAAHASIAPYGPVTSNDGQTIYLGVQNGREWTRFCAIVLRDPALADDARFRTNPDRVANRAALDAAMAAVFHALPAAEILRRLEDADIAYARMNSVEALLAHPQLAARGRWREVNSPAGPVRVSLPPIDIDGLDPALGPVPALGDRTDAILTELGIDAATIAAWRTEGMI